MHIRSRASRVDPMRRAARGFTLIELAVAMTLLGILIAAGLPSFMAWIGNAKVRTVAEALRDGAHRAQSEAVRLNQSVVLSLTNSTPALNAPAVANGRNWSIQTVAPFGGADPTRPAAFAGGGVLSDVASNVSIAGATFAMCFNSNGRLIQMAAAATGVPGATCAAGVQQFDITHANADRRLRVRVELGGQVRMCDPDRPVLSATSPEGCPP